MRFLGQGHVGSIMIQTLGLLLFASFLNGQVAYTISTLAGGWSTLNGYMGDGGPAIEARLNEPGGLALGPYGELYISDTWNHAIRFVDARARSAQSRVRRWRDSPETEAPRLKQLLFPRGIALDSHGNLYIADRQNNRIRLVTPDGRISTFAGTGQRGYSGDGALAINAKLNWPDGIAIDAADVLYFTDSQNNMVRKITPDGMITKVAGEAPVGKPSANPVGSFDSPRGIALGPDGSSMWRTADTRGSAR